MCTKVAKANKVIDSLRLEVKERDYVIQKLEEVLLLKDKVKKAIIEEDVYSKAETNKKGDDCYRYEEKQRQDTDVIDMQIVSLREEIKQANTIIIDLKFQLEEANAKEEIALRSKEQSDINIKNLLSQITKANKIIKGLELPKEEISILELRLHIQESKEIEEALLIQVSEKDASYCKLEEKVI